VKFKEASNLRMGTPTSKSSDVKRHNRMFEMY
jgi:hypothetical protein